MRKSDPRRPTTVLPRGLRNRIRRVLSRREFGGEGRPELPARRRIEAEDRSRDPARRSFPDDRTNRTDDAVNVFLFPFDCTQVFFYADRREGDDTHPPDHPGLRGWVERTARRLKAHLKHPKSWLGRKLKQAWDWLQRRMDPDEHLLAALRTATAIEVHHPATLASEEVRALWSGYLRRRRRRHLPWLVVNAVLSPLSILLTPLPGPNVIGYWFVYRAVHHLLILVGIGRALSGRVETTFHPDAGLETPGGCADEGYLARVSARYGLNGLHDFVGRLATGSSSATSTMMTNGVGGTGGAQGPCDC